MTFENIIILVLLGVIFYLYYLYQKAKTAKKEASSNYYSTRYDDSDVPTAPKPKEVEHKEKLGNNTKEEEEEEVEYKYEDPNFKLPPLIPKEKMQGIIVGENGDAIYGNDKRYFKDLYYGRVSHKAKVELKDKRVYKNQFESNIIKVLVVKNEWVSEEGRIGWVGLDYTSFRDKYNPETREIEE